MMFFIRGIQRSTQVRMAFVLGLFFLLLTQITYFNSFEFNAKVEANKAKDLSSGIRASSSSSMTWENHEYNDTTWWVGNLTKISSPTEGENGSTFPLIDTISSIIRSDADASQNHKIGTDSSHPLFFNEGLQNICSTSEERESIMKGMENSSRPANHTFRCLATSEDGTWGTFTTLNLASLSDMIESGDVILFGAGIDQQMWEQNWFAGRLMNRLIQLRNALAHSAACGKLIILPRTVSKHDPEAWGEFDCADFRRMGRPKIDTTIVTTTTESDEIPRVWPQNDTDTKESVESFCSMVIPKDAKFWFYYNTQGLNIIRDYRTRSKAAHRIMMAWWGLGPGYFRCTACSESDLNATIAWMRSGDVFRRRRRYPAYGQPPLEYYIQSIKLSGANNIRLLSEDGMRTNRRNFKNPLLSELPNFDFRNQNGSSGNSAIEVTLVLGETFFRVLQQLFCARTAIIGVSTLTVIFPFTPNAQTLFLAKSWIYSEALEYGTADIYYYDPFSNHENNSSMGVATNNYSVYQNWVNSEEQRQEMILYQGGRLKPLRIAKYKNRNMTIHMVPL